MRDNTRTLLTAFAVVASMAALGCGDDDGPFGDGDAGDAGVGADVSGDASTGLRPARCEDIVLATRVGDECGGSPCPAGSQCSRLDDTDTGICRQLCLPDVCETVCAASETCAPLADSPGTGVCAERRTGDRRAWETCASTGAYCGESLECLVSAAGETQGICLPACDDGVCERAEGRDASCVIHVRTSSGDERFCAPNCSSGEADSECPDSMLCLASSDGFVCAFPQPCSPDDEGVACGAGTTCQPSGSGYACLR